MKVAELLEGRGADALDMAEWIADMNAPDTTKQFMKQLVTELIKDGFEMIRTGNLRMSLEENPDAPGQGFTISFPDPHSGHQRLGILDILYVAFDVDQTGAVAFKKFTAKYSAAEILGMGLQEFKDYMRSRARPIR